MNIDKADQNIDNPKDISYEYNAPLTSSAATHVTRNSHKADISQTARKPNVTFSIRKSLLQLLNLLLTSGIHL